MSRSAGIRTAMFHRRSAPSLDLSVTREASFHVHKWGEQQNKGRDLWRLKI